jgi:hypothetical protein
VLGQTLEKSGISLKRDQPMIEPPQSSLGLLMAEGNAGASTNSVTVHLRNTRDKFKVSIDYILREHRLEALITNTQLTPNPALK